MRSYGQYCSIAKALDVVGDRWTLLVVRELLLQESGSRYTDLARGLPGIATNLLTDRLRDLERAGVVFREEAPPPVATTLYHLTDAGRDLSGVLRELGRWGTRFMAEANGGEAFRSHWLTFPVAEFLKDTDPEGPPVTIQIYAHEESAVIETEAGELRVRTGTATAPDVVLTGAPQLILGLLTKSLTLPQARTRGLKASGAVALLQRIRADAVVVAGVRPAVTPTARADRPEHLT